MCLDKTRGNEVRSETNYFKKLRFVVERSTYARMVLRRIINTTLIATDIMAGFKRPSMHDNIILGQYLRKKEGTCYIRLFNYPPKKDVQSSKAFI